MFYLVCNVGIVETSLEVKWWEVVKYIVVVNEFGSNSKRSRWSSASLSE